MFKLSPKILITFFLLIFACQLLSLIALLTLPTISRAGDLKFTPQVAIPDYTFNSSDKTTGNIANYVRAIYKYAIGIVGILAAVVLMFGGIIWLTAGGNATQIGNAKAWIGASLTGLVLALLSYMILATVNPALVNFKISAIQTPPEASSTQQTIGNAIKIDGCCDRACNTPGVNKDNCASNYGGDWKDNQSGLVYFCGNDNKCTTKTESSINLGCCSYTNYTGNAINCFDADSSDICQVFCKTDPQQRFNCAYDQNRTCGQGTNGWYCAKK